MPSACLMRIVSGSLRGPSAQTEVTCAVRQHPAHKSNIGGLLTAAHNRLTTPSIRLPSARMHSRMRSAWRAKLLGFGCVRAASTPPLLHRTARGVACSRDPAHGSVAGELLDHGFAQRTDWAGVLSICEVAPQTMAAGSLGDAAADSADSVRLVRPGPSSSLIGPEERRAAAAANAAGAPNYPSTGPRRSWRGDLRRGDFRRGDSQNGNSPWSAAQTGRHAFSCPAWHQRAGAF
jgi:hypothetical protein